MMNGEVNKIKVEANNELTNIMGALACMNEDDVHELVAKYIAKAYRVGELAQKQKDAGIARSELVAAGKQAKYTSESLANDAHISGYVAACEVIYKAILNQQDE